MLWAEGSFFAVFPATRTLADLALRLRPGFPLELLAPEPLVTELLETELLRETLFPAGAVFFAPLPVFADFEAGACVGFG